MLAVPRVMELIGGPREVSMPWPLKDAGGLLVPGERMSLPDAVGCGEKYDGEVAVETWLGVRVVGVEGLVARRVREVTETEAAELLEGRRRSVGSVGVRWCFAGDAGCALDALCEC